ncbi:hypothetical protein RIF29_41871 [Crotalaria pallida]|uniref:Polysaccharide biosynthesis domain-containing protein n=1 Tax=Crotalaria pallida TaxID=3830 RepID=A0AAN9E6I8_CROPI
MQRVSEKRWFVCLLAIVGIIGASLFVVSLIQTPNNSFLCSLTNYSQNDNNPTSFQQLNTILHYATSSITPQQSFSEITVTLDVLKSLNRPCNFLIFGLGIDSLMWNSFNPRGTTLFLEEDPSWFQKVMKNAPQLNAHAVKYRTQLREADALLSSYRSEPFCSPARAAPLRSNERCKLALNNLPDEVYEKEWDLIMIDAPKGYFAEAPGRMAAIFSAAVMGRNRKGSGVTHVFLHDVDRKVEKVYAEEFLCRKNLVKGVGRLWHFEIPSKVNSTRHGDDDDRFC